MTERRPSPSIPPETAETLSQRDLALLKLGRLMADNQPPVPEAAVGDGDLIDISKLAEAWTGGQDRPRPAGRAVRTVRPRAKPTADAAGPGRRLMWRVMEILIVFLVVIWVFLLGILVGRSRPEESGHQLVVWLEKMAGWAPPQPVLISPAAETRPDSPPGDSQDTAAYGPGP